MNKRKWSYNLVRVTLIVLGVLMGGYYWSEIVNEVPVNNDVLENVDINNIDDISSESEVSTNNITETEVVSNEGSEVESEIVEVANRKSFIKPLNNGTVVRRFFNLNNNEDEKLNSILEYNGVYRPSLAVSYSDNGKASDVLAVSDGYVERIENDNNVGQRLVLRCGDYQIIYHSIADIVVSEGQNIKQGNIIGVCADNEYDGDIGKHISVSVLYENAYLDFEKMLEN